MSQNTNPSSGRNDAPPRVATQGYVGVRARRRGTPRACCVPSDWLGTALSASRAWVCGRISTSSLRTNSARAARVKNRRRTHHLEGRKPCQALPVSKDEVLQDARLSRHLREGEARCNDPQTTYAIHARHCEWRVLSLWPVHPRLLNELQGPRAAAARQQLRRRGETLVNPVRHPNSVRMRGKNRLGASSEPS